MITTVIGAYPKPSYLLVPDWFNAKGGTDTSNPTAGYLEAIKKMGNENEIEKIFLKATKEVIHDQIECGIDIITDGEIRRENYIHYHCRHIQGIDFNKLTKKFARTGNYECFLPTITNKVEAKDPFLIKEWLAGLIKSKSICIAYETVTDELNRLPLLAPMSAVAGRMSIQAGAHSLEKPQKGRGLLLGGAPGVVPGNVLILGGGVVGENAAIIATGMQASVSIVDKSLQRLNELQSKFGNTIIPLQSDEINLNEHIKNCDLLIGGVLVPGANAPKLVSKEMINSMKRGAVIVDVAIDQGGCVETSKPTTHADPTYMVGDIVHYCVANMPGSVPMTSTLALNAVTLPFVLKLAQQGYKNALSSDANFLAGLNICQGNVTYKAVADDLNYEYVSASSAIN